MKTFKCNCDNQLFFNNTRCLSCDTHLGYDFRSDRLEPMVKNKDHYLLASTGEKVKPCKNNVEFSVCNSIIPFDYHSDLCISCQLNRTIPNLTFENNIQKWSKLENAKRRLVRTLLNLGLPVNPSTSDNNGLAFDFIEDQQQNPEVINEFVSTGHKNGLITINLAEADDIYLENAKNDLGEQYRTPLGHLRHESGHYYFDLLIRNSKWIDSFRDLYGDERQDYDKALADYYQSKPHNNWNQKYISEYAMVHPLEDWAECWAHYLHMIDTLETARSLKILADNCSTSIDAQLANWSYLSMSLNELNRSMGLNDAYPFIMSAEVTKKIRLVDQVIDPSYLPIQQEGVG